MIRFRTLSYGLFFTTACLLTACDNGASSPNGEASAKAEAKEAQTAAPPPSAAETAPSAAPSEDPAAAAAASAEEEKATAGVRSYHRHHHGGVGMFVHMAIDTLGVPDDKKADLEKIQTDLHKSMAPVHDAEREVLTILADGVAAGKVDEGKLKPAVAKEEAAASAAHEKEAEALEKLHAALTPEQRAALVDKVNAHVEIWQKSAGEEYGNKEKGGRLAELRDELGLSTEQEDKISDALKKDAPAKVDPAKVEAHVKAFTEAFSQDKFDAKSLTTAKEADAYVAKHGTERLVRFYSIVTPILTPEQRTKLADRLRERAEDHGGKADHEARGDEKAKHEKKAK
jgi:Spy/CpxP family protein refolding chaperone